MGQLEVSLPKFVLGDHRLNRRAAKISQRLNMSDLQLGFPGIFTQECELKAFYRFVNNARVKPKKLVASNISAITEYFELVSATSSGETKLEGIDVYCYQDTTFIDYSDRFHVKLGYTQNKTPRENSALLHSMIACTALGHPVGLLHQDFFVRTLPFGATQTDEYTQRNFEDRESFKWVRGLDHVKYLTENTSVPLRPIVIGDRESDSVAVMKAHADQQIDFIIRSKSNRSLIAVPDERISELAEASLDKLHSWICKGEGVTKGKQRRKLHARSTSKYYEASCDIHYANVTINGLDRPIGVIYLHEEVETRSEPIGPTKAAEWFILTSLELNSLQDAIKCLDAYTQRWPVTEDFHKVLKTGAKIEHRQFESKEALEKVVALLSLVSVNILSLRYFAEQKGELPVEKSSWANKPQLLKILPQLDQEFLQNRDRDFSRPGTVKRLLQIIARMGGHQGYARKGRPGWKVLWIGNRKLNAILDSLNKYG